MRGGPATASVPRHRAWNGVTIGYGRPFSHAEGRPDPYDRRMRKRALVLALLVGSLVLASCSGDNDPVSNVTATSATFNAHGTCDSGQPNPCEWRWRYRKVGDSAWTETPLQGPVTGSASNVPLKWDVSGLTPGTQYEEQIGGRGDNVSTISWTSSTVKFTTAAATNTVFSDGFESGDFASWSQVQTAGDGTAVVQSAVVKTGAAAAQLSESATAGSKAYIRKTLPSAQQELTVSGAFRIATAPASGGNVPFFRLLDPASARVVSIYRQNGSAGTIGLGFGGTNVTTTGKLALGTWATVELHVITAGTSSTIEVKLNGAQVYATTTASLGTAGVQTIQVGNDTAAQAFTLAADDIDVEGAGSATPSAPANVTLPTISGTAQAGPDADGEQRHLGRDAADHVHVPVAALRQRRGDVRRDRQRDRRDLRRDGGGRRQARCAWWSRRRTRSARRTRRPTRPPSCRARRPRRRTRRCRRSPAPRSRDRR